MSDRSKPLGVVVALICAALLPAAVCEAGIVVLKRGDVIVGKIKPKQAEGALRLTWPHGSRLDAGKMDLKAEEIRWSDAASDVLTDAYFERHLEDDLRGAVWLRMREEYRLRKGAVRDPGLEIEIPTPKISLDPLDVQATPGEGFTLRKPRGWASRETPKDRILILEAPEDKSRGFRPRVHAFSVEAAGAAPKEQVDWIEGELRDLRDATQGLAEFRLRGPVRFKTDAKGKANARFSSESRLKDRVIVAVRRVAFRGKRTVVVAGYTDARDLPAFESLLQQCLESLVVTGD